MQVRHGRTAIQVKAIIGAVMGAALWYLAFASGLVGAGLAGLACGALIYAFFGKVAQATPDPPRAITKSDAPTDL